MSTWPMHHTMIEILVYEPHLEISFLVVESSKIIDLVLDSEWLVDAFDQEDGDATDETQWFSLLQLSMPTTAGLEDILDQFILPDLYGDLIRVVSGLYALRDDPVNIGQIVWEYAEILHNIVNCEEIMYISD